MNHVMLHRTVEKLLETREKLTGLQIANFHRQLERRDVIRSHHPLCTAPASVLHTESCDRGPAIGSRDPGDIHRTFGRHGDGGPVGGLGYWERTKWQITFWVVQTANPIKNTQRTGKHHDCIQNHVRMEQVYRERKKRKRKEKKAQWRGGMCTYCLGS